MLRGVRARTALVTSATAALAVVLAACGSSSGGSSSAGGTSGAGAVTINVGGQGSDNQAGFDASHLFDNTPYKIKYSTFSSPADNLTALAQGKVDFANNVSQWTATQASAGATPSWTAATAPYKNVLVSAPGNPAQYSRFVIAASKKSGITNIQQAKHLKWGIIPGSSLNLMADVVLNKLGWTTKDIQIVNLDATNQVLALETGKVDVLFNVTDNLAPALAGGAKIIGTAYDYGLTVYTGFLASSKSLNDPAKASAMQDFVKRLVEYENWYNTNPTAAQAALVSFDHLTAAQAKNVWEYARVIPEAPTAAIQTYSQSLADFAQKVGLINQKVDASALFDDRFSAIINSTVASTNLIANLKASYS